MTDAILHFQFEDAPSKEQILTYHLPGDEIPWATMEAQGDIICIIDCRDGLFVVMREF